MLFSAIAKHAFYLEDFFGRISEYELPKRSEKRKQKEEAVKEG